MTCKHFTYSPAQGGGLLADLILGHSPVCAVDIDPVRCAHLRARATEGWFPGLCVEEGDVRQLDLTGWKGRVDCLHAGIPCPLWSQARRGRGAPPDFRPDVVRIADGIRPRFVFIECVREFRVAHDDLAERFRAIGYTLGDPLETDASEVGAPFGRARYWALASADAQGQPARPIHAEVGWLPPADAGPWWEADPRGLRMDDGDADRVVRFAAIGDAQVPLQAAAAWRLLGGP